MRRASQILAPLGLFLLMVVWDWLATAAVIYTANRALAAIPFSMSLAACSFLGITGLRRTRVYAAVWVVGAGVGTAIGLYFP